MMQFDFIGCVPVLPVRIIAGMVGKSEAELTIEITEHTECGVWLESKYPSIEKDDLYDFLETRYIEAFDTVFG